MNVVFIVPTGIGAEIGGSCGDATPSAKLIASVCDKLIVHPNVVNAADINEMTSNMLYVEGSILDRFLKGNIGLEETRSNKILLVTNKPVLPETINAVSAARVTLGADITILGLDVPLKMIATMDSNKASGDIYNLEEAIEQIQPHSFDVLVVNTPIRTNDIAVKRYLTQEGGTNIWGGVEAKLSKIMSERLKVPVIHGPVESSEVMKTFNEVVDPRKAAELVSVCYLHCCLKGAHVAPKMTDRRDRGYWNTDIDFLVSPIAVFGTPHFACMNAGIPIIVVKENRTVLNDPMPSNVIVVENYLEATGVVASKRAGVTLSSVRRPLERTKVQ